MFRGRGTPNQQRRSGGDTKLQDYHGTPQSNRSGGGGYKNDIGSSPRGNRKDGPPQSTPKGTPSNISSKSHTSLKDQNPTRTGGSASKERPRSRSPLSREGEKEKLDEMNEEETEEKPEEEKKSFRYTGRPGEKKFSGRCRLFIANLHNTTTDEELKELFGEYGDTGEVYVNRDKGFGFIRMDYRHNAEIAKLSLDKKLLKGRNIQVRYATHASAIELHGLDNYASNEFIEQSMSTFGAVERAVVVCDDRGRSKGYAIVEFEWKKSAAKVLDRLKDEMFVLGRLPKPVFAKPYILTDEEEGVRDEALERLEGLDAEREAQPRFISPNSFEYTWAKRWRDLFIEEQDKKARLEQELTDARCKLEFEMEAAIRQQEASRIREDLVRRQEELRMLEEDMIRRQEADMRILERSRQRELAARQGRPDPSPRDEVELHQNEMQLSRENAARQQDFNHLRQRAEMQLNQHEGISDSPGSRNIPQHMKVGIRPDMLAYSRTSQGGPQHSAGYPRGHPGLQPGAHQASGHPGGSQQGGPRMHGSGVMDYRNQQQRGPPRDQREMQMQQRELQQREMQQRELQQREMQQREMQQREMLQREMLQRGGGQQNREIPQRDLPPPRDLPASQIAREAAGPPKENTEEKKERPAIAKPATPAR